MDGFSVSDVDVFLPCRRISKVEVPVRRPFPPPRGRTYRPVPAWHGCGLHAALPSPHARRLFSLVADDLAVRLVRVGHLGVVTSVPRLLLLSEDGRISATSPDEYQHHSGQHYHFLTFQPLGFGQRLRSWLAFLLRACLQQADGLGWRCSRFPCREPPCSRL